MVAAFEGLKWGSKIDSTWPSTTTQIRKRPGPPAAATPVSNRRARAGKEATTAEARKAAAGPRVAPPQNVCPRSRRRRRSAARPAAISSVMTTNPISSAGDGSIATRMGASVVPATSNDARLIQSAMPATVAALTAVTAGPRKKGSGGFFMALGERIGSRRTSCAGPVPRAPPAPTHASGKPGCPNPHL